VTPEDAPAVTKLLVDNREFLAPWEPVRPEEFFTLERQQAIIADALTAYERGAMVPHVIVGDGGEVVGRINLNTVVRGAFQSCSLGYWVGAEHNGRGYATRAVDDIKRIAFEEQGLHRVEASTLLDNIGSQRVLERNGFVRFALAPTYLKIAGKWQDCALYQVITTTDM
jgi:[ribosomal protein S5]-alanine N-acetyltransferase